MKIHVENYKQNIYKILNLTWVKYCFILSFILFPSQNSLSENTQLGNEKFEKAWKMILQRIEWSVEDIEPEQFPMLADNLNGEWEVFTNPKWTGGFWVGMLWLAYEKTRENKYLDWAKTWNNKILGFENEDNHDRGFVYFYSSVYGYQITGNEKYYKSAILAARKLVDLSEKKSKVIPQNLKDRTNIIIDTMMNLPLLWWADENAARSDPYKHLYQEIALNQTTKTMMDFIRADGSTWQSVHYDTTSGKIIKKHTHQGMADSTCWSRGQSWAFYGFLKAYEKTKQNEFLDTALKLGDYIISHLPDNGVPWYDYDDPGKKKDTSAGAIAATAFIQLAEILTDSSEIERYKKTGLHIMKGLITHHLTPFVGKDSPPGILRNGCYQIFNNADSETIWGDYYFMEALAGVLYP